MNKFDRELTLADLLGGINRDKLRGALSALAGAGFRLLDGSGTPLLGGATAAQGTMRLPLVLDLEPLGYLEGAGDEDTLRAVVALLELLLRASARYRMASTLHVEAVSADYEALQHKHVALQESEARYKALAEELEQRVREQVQALDAAQRQLYQAEKLASVGQLAAGVAHEINNPIGFIRSNLKTGRDYLERFKALAPLVQGGDMGGVTVAWREGELEFVLNDFSQLLDESLAGADRVARIVADLKGFSNVDGAEEAMVDLNDNIRAAANMIAPGLPAGIELKLDLQPIPRLLCLPGHLNQVLINLLKNASQAIAGQGTVTVASDVAEGHIRIRVSDDGCGIPADTLRRVFDPFFTTRDVGAGTGLGLTVCRDIVQAHGGRIDVASAVGKGTTFSVYLPLP
ncbi:MAG: two-component sensor histidine kinase [Betaproteobacteria bacterium]|nr:MAG: two-component sensor histidine kinase [Betaproteobacteria bacterium]